MGGGQEGSRRVVGPMSTSAEACCLSLCLDFVSSAVTVYFCMESFKVRDHPSFRETLPSVCDLDTRIKKQKLEI